MERRPRWTRATGGRAVEAALPCKSEHTDLTAISERIDRLSGRRQPAPVRRSRTVRDSAAGSPCRKCGIWLRRRHDIEEHMTGVKNVWARWNSRIDIATDRPDRGAAGRALAAETWRPRMGTPPCHGRGRSVAAALTGDGQAPDRESTMRRSGSGRVSSAAPRHRNCYWRALGPAPAGVARGLKRGTRVIADDRSPSPAWQSLRIERRPLRLGRRVLSSDGSGLHCV
jgi:hypothetical protein